MAFGDWYRGKTGSSSHRPPFLDDDDRPRHSGLQRARPGSRPYHTNDRARCEFPNYARRTDNPDVDPTITGARPKTYPRFQRTGDRHDQVINRRYEHQRTLKSRGDATQENDFQKSSEPSRNKYSHGQRTDKSVFAFREGFGRSRSGYGLEDRSGADGESYQRYQRVPHKHRTDESPRSDEVHRPKTRDSPHDQSTSTQQSMPLVKDTEFQEDASTRDTSATCSADGNLAELQPNLDSSVQDSISETYRVKPQTKTLPFTERQLETFLEEKPSTVLSELVQKKDKCMALLSQDQICDSTLQLIIQVLSSLCSLDHLPVHIEDLNVVLTMVESSLFFSKHLTRFLVCLPIEEPHEINGEDDNDAQRLGLVVELLRLFLQNKPSSYSEVCGALILLERVVTSECLIADLKQLKTSYHAVEEAQRTAKERASEKPPPNNFRDIQIFPESKEIRQVTKPFLRKNIIKGTYESVEHYLDVQFRLLREDFVAPLREGVTEFLSMSDTSSRHQDIRIYNNVHILKRKMDHGSLIHTLCFDTKRLKRLKWELSKRLMYGSFVCLTKDEFQHILCATVENRNTKDLEHGRIDVRFLNETRNQSEGPYIMAESAAYFEACRHVLDGLQKIDEYNFPFKKYIVDVSSTVDPPSYLNSEDLGHGDSVTYDLTLLDTKSSTATEIPVLKIETWPNAEDLHLDESQKAALHTALTKEFAIIQGPPGTGKTYIGLKIVQLLLHNLSPPSINEGERVGGGAPLQSPILVVCYTNHALDQFLEGIYQFGDYPIVRVGGQSNSEVLQERNLSFIRQKRRKGRKENRTCRREVGEVLYHLRESDEEIRRILLKIELPTKVLPNVKALKEYMTSSEHKALLLQDQQDKAPREVPQKLLNWLGVIEQRKFETTEEKIFNENAAYDLQSMKRCGKNHDVEPIVELQKPDVMTDEEANRVERVWSLKIFSRWRLYRLWVKRYLEDHTRELQRQRQIHDDLSKQLQALNLHKGVRQQKVRRVQKDPREVEMHLKATTEEIQGLLLKIELPTKVLLNVRALQWYMSRSEYGALLIERQQGQQPQEDPQKLLNWLGVIEANEHIQVEDEGRRIQMERQVDDVDKLHITTEQRQQSMEQHTYFENAAYDLKCNKRCGKNRDVEPTVELQKPDVMTEEEAAGVERVWSLRKWDRWRLYRFWVKSYLEDHDAKLQKQRQKHDYLIKRLQFLNGEEDLEILKEAGVIGMTTTGAAKCREVLQRLRPGIVVVEEAAEVLEAHIITSLTENCQHLILIGDHQQLRPNPTVYRLARQFNLDTSLFERMINNGMPCRSLTHQHRMRPEISNLMKKHFYKNLYDDESVLKMDNVKGVAKNMFFVNHQHLESKCDDNKTKSNQYEAEFLVGLCKYLLQQGYERSQITILTAYTGQLFCFRRLMDKATFGGVRVCVVDNFQGEENDIILLSLVRSNEEGSIGFLRTSNRVCVALSRARMGFYCIGNGSILKKAQIWQDILGTLEAEHRIGASLPLVCRNHPDKITQVTSKEDFADKVPLGGCDVPCEYRLPCGHVCVLLCHGFDTDHEEYKCEKSCVRVCDRQHSCPFECYKKCECHVEVTKTMSDCGHVIQISCHEFDSITCPKPCPRFCDDGLHQCRKLCGESCLETCPEECLRALSCGHSCTNECGETCIEHCEVRVERTLQKCGHTVLMECGQQPERFDCKVQVSRDLPKCSHRTEMLCHEDPKTIQCQYKCERVLECAHPCEQLCWELCTKFCRVKVERTLPKCGHTVCMDCGAKPHKNEWDVLGEDPYKCKERCEKTLQCGHRCPNVCSALCTVPELKRENPSYRYLLVQRFKETLKWNVKPCNEPVERTYTSCDHQVTVPCHKDITKVPCSNRCEKLLSCGHRCPRKCFQICPPENVQSQTLYKQCLESPLTARHFLLKDQKRYQYSYKKYSESSEEGTESERDEESFFKNFLRDQRGVYGYLLSLCQEKCQRKLECGHTCQNKCGEPCPPMKSDAKGRYLSLGIKTECLEEVAKKLPGCDHYVSVRCFMGVSSFICKEKCERVLECGHRCPRPCREVCPKRLGDDAVLPKDQRHVRTYLSSVCQEKCERELACGHKCPNKCGEPCPPVRSKAIRKFLRGIKTECQEEVKKKLPRCDHLVSVRCSANVSRFICTEKCEKVLPCGHRCPNKCFEPCAGDQAFKVRATRGSKNYRKRTGPREKCEVMVDKASTCGHKSKPMPCWKAESAAHAPCNVPCGAVLRCGHRCTGNCDSCKQCTQHKLCTEVCNRQLLCGHKCTGSCGSDCSPDCRRCRGDSRQDSGHDLKSSSPCKHNVVHRYLKTNACFRPCNQKLQCKHPCIGVCGEPCPPFCNVCDKKRVRTNLPKGQFHPRDLYVYLPDCKHLCQVRVLDRTFAAINNTLGRGCLQIRHVPCPKCKEPIRHCSRYDDVLQIISESINTARQICRQNRKALQEKDGATTPLSFAAGKWMRCRRGHVFYLEEGGNGVEDRKEPITCPECLKQKNT